MCYLAIVRSLSLPSFCGCRSVAVKLVVFHTREIGLADLLKYNSFCFLIAGLSRRAIRNFICDTSSPSATRRYPARTTTAVMSCCIFQSVPRSSVVSGIVVDIFQVIVQGHRLLDNVPDITVLTEIPYDCVFPAIQDGVVFEDRLSEVLKTTT